MGVRIKYNAPVVLTFVLVCIAVMAVTALTHSTFNYKFFAVYPDMSWTSPRSWFRMISHVAGHASWEHLVGNMVFILLLGPMLEEKHGALNMLEMIIITGLVTGLFTMFFTSTGLLGASGVVFMMIVLSSFANVKEGEIPITFILIVILFLGKELLNATSEDRVSQSAHIIGGICGSLYGYFRERKMPEVASYSG